MHRLKFESTLLLSRFVLSSKYNNFILISKHFTCSWHYNLSSKKSSSVKLEKDDVNDNTYLENLVSVLLIMLQITIFQEQLLKIRIESYFLLSYSAIVI